MKQKLPIVKCLYPKESEKSASDLLEESFRIYLIRILAAAERPAAQGGVACTQR